MRRATSALVALLLGFSLASHAFAEESLRDLVRALDDESGKVRSQAYQTLVTRRDPAALPVLRRALPQFSDLGRYHGIAVLDRYPAKESEVSWKKLAKTDVPYLRLCAGLWLARRGEERWLDEAVEALTAPGLDAQVRLWMIRRVTAHDPPEMRAGLRTLLRPTEDGTVLRQLVTFHHAQQDLLAVPQTRALLADGRIGVRAAAAALLYALGESARAGALAEMVKQGVPYADFSVVAEILSANRHVDDAILDAIAERMGSEKSVWNQLLYIEIMRRFRHRAGRAPLKQLIQHRHARVARAAFDALVEMSGPVREDTLKPMLRGRDVERRLWAAEALRRQDDISGIGAVVFALQRGTALQRKVAAEMLGSFVLDMSVEPLLDALEDEAVGVRTVALASLGTVLQALFPYRTLDLRSTGYAPAANEETRRLAVAVIRDWWEAQREADW